MTVTSSCGVSSLSNDLEWPSDHLDQAILNLKITARSATWLLSHVKIIQSFIDENLISLWLRGSGDTI